MRPQKVAVVGRKYTELRAVSRVEVAADMAQQHCCINLGARSERRGGGEHHWSDSQASIIISEETHKRANVLGRTTVVDIPDS